MVSVLERLTLGCMPINQPYTGRAVCFARLVARRGLASRYLPVGRPWPLLRRRLVARYCTYLPLG